MTDDPLTNLGNLLPGGRKTQNDDTLTERIVQMIRGLDRESPDPLRQLSTNLRQMVGDKADAPASGASAPDDHDPTKTDRALEFVYAGWDTDDLRQRCALAYAALDLDPNLPDAYVLLAEATDDLEQAIDLYRYALRLCEGELPAEAMTGWAGNFWLIHETRPYMRTRSGLAQTLWQAEQSQEAIDHFRELLRLDQTDGLGTRYLLAQLYLQIEDHDALADLLTAYPDDVTAHWLYTRALYAWRVHDLPAANRLLRLALSANIHVPAYLLCRKELPEEPPFMLSFGSEDEAAEYVIEFGPLWQQTPGAIEWIEANAPSQ